MKSTLISVVCTLVLATVSSASFTTVAKHKATNKRAIASGTKGCLKFVFEDGSEKWLQDQVNNDSVTSQMRLISDTPSPSEVYLQVTPTSFGSSNMAEVTLPIVSSLSNGLFLTDNGPVDGLIADLFSSFYNFDADTGAVGISNLYGCSDNSIFVLYEEEGTGALSGCKAASLVFVPKTN
ncbi:hypothetical protein BT69DRAFT_1330894 [Atractiella rhizophila]|nr:hypothetical protein BT69DRAFT_1330894 [Atractiella rhizophila]